MGQAAEVIRREFIYVWYYFTVQLRQIFWYYVLGIVLGSVISVFVKDRIHGLFRSMGDKKLGVLGVIPASILGIASPLCMYGTIPLAASFSKSGIRDDWLAAFMMSSILLNPQLIIYSTALGSAAAFMLTGPSTKITNLGALKIVLGLRRFLLYLAFVMAFSFITGLIVNQLI